MDHSRQGSFQATRFVFWVSLMAAIAGWSFYAYMFHAVSAVGKATIDLSSESAKLETEQSQALQLKKDLAANQARQPVLNSYFVDASDPVPLFETLEGYGHQTNVAVSINSVDVKKAPNRLVVTVTGDGSFADVYRFVAFLEAAPYEFSIANATLRTVAAPGSPAAPAGKTPVSAGATTWESRITISILSVTGVSSVPTK